MNKYFVIVFVAIYIALVATPQQAFARSQSHAADPIAPNDTSIWMGEAGKASYYGPAYDGHRSAGGTRFNQMAMTAAHPWLPFGTKVKVMLDGSRRSVIVTITDRLYSSRRILDLSVGAARQLGMINRGIADVTLSPA